MFSERSSRETNKYEYVIILVRSWRHFVLNWRNRSSEYVELETITFFVVHEYETKVEKHLKLATGRYDNELRSCEYRQSSRIISLKGKPCMRLVNVYYMYVHMYITCLWTRFSGVFITCFLNEALVYYTFMYACLCMYVCVYFMGEIMMLSICVSVRMSSLILQKKKLGKKMCTYICMLLIFFL